jgi:hypothetical protein
MSENSSKDFYDLVKNDRQAFLFSLLAEET